MRTSKAISRAYKALQELTGWQFKKPFKARHVVLEAPKDVADMYDGLTFKKGAAVAAMVRHTLASDEYDGMGMTPEEVLEATGLSCARDRKGGILFHSSLTGSDIAALCRLFKHND